MKRKLSAIIVYILIFICLGGIGYSSYHITKWYLDSKKTKETTEVIMDEVEIEEITGGETVVETTDIDATSPYWTYIKMNLIDVDFNTLKETNSDTVGFLQVGGTNINYPYVQTTDNEFYLTHTFDKTYNTAGWLFQDYRNDASLIERNNIIYAHGRLDNTMFGTLKNTLKDTWFNNTDNHVVKVSTPSSNTLWEVFSVYHLPTTSDYIQTEFNSDEEYETWLNMLKARSAYDFGVTLTKDDKVLTLSTCYNNDEKMVLHARLIKIQEK